MDAADVIITGGGVAGLTAAGELARAGKRVIVLEARDRLGGRVLTERRPGWPVPVELGAQFVHGGNAPFLRFLDRHRIRRQRVPGRHWRFDAAGLREIDATEGIAAVTKHVQERRMRGWSFEKFMRHLGDKVSPVDRELATGFVEGFEAAPCDQMSAVAVAGETLEDDEQYLLPAGYDRVVEALVRDLRNDHVLLMTGACCRAVTWRHGAVEVKTSRGDFRARSAIVTIPLGVWQAKAPSRGAIAFQPELRGHRAVASAMGMGHVIRLNVRFDGRRWHGLLPAALRRVSARGFGFIHARPADVPVWWELQGVPMVSGWAGGPSALRLSAKSPAAIKASALRRLGQIVGLTSAALDSAVIDVASHAWSRDPFSRGAYSFTRAGQDDASERLRAPVKETLFFAGEATADGEEVGTVHGAFSSGLRAAQEVRRALGG